MSRWNSEYHTGGHAENRYEFFGCMYLRWGKTVTVEAVSSQAVEVQAQAQGGQRHPRTEKLSVICTCKLTSDLQ